MGNELAGAHWDCNGGEQTGGKRRGGIAESYARCIADVDSDDDGGFEELYDMDPKVLGTGRFSVVHACWRRDQPLKRYAVKVIDTLVAASTSLSRIRDEIRILQTLGRHPGLVELVDVDQSAPDCIRLVIELCEGGELYDRVKEKKHFSEKEARGCVANLLEAVTYVHCKGIMHRDLKPENVLMVSKTSNTDVKISDFGLAKIAVDWPRKLPRASSILGSDFYLAPELIAQQEYGREVDIWACGVMTYILLCGSLPFYSNVLHKLYRQIVERELTFSESVWSGVSTSAKDFILRMLEVRPADRLTAQDSLSHPWLSKAKSA